MQKGNSLRIGIGISIVMLRQDKKIDNNSEDRPLSKPKCQDSWSKMLNSLHPSVCFDKTRQSAKAYIVGICWEQWNHLWRFGLIILGLFCASLPKALPRLSGIRLERKDRGTAVVGNSDLCASERSTIPDDGNLSFSVHWQEKRLKGWIPTQCARAKS